MTDLSDDAHDKLQAALNYAAPDPDDYLGAEYRDACGAWFSRLTQGERWRLAMVIAAYARGSEADAEQLAIALPPAPRSVWRRRERPRALRGETAARPTG